MRRTRRGMRGTQGTGPLGFPWFDHGVMLTGTLAVGSPLAVVWLMRSGGEWDKVALAMTPYAVCIGTGYLGLLLARWVSRSVDG